MALTFASATTELLARGFDDLSATRSGYFINRAHWRLCSMAPWPFLEKSTTPGASPVTINDLKSVLYVVDQTNDVMLEGIDQRSIRDFDPDLTNSGNPELWYLTGTSTLTVWPVNTTNTILVRYLKRPAVLTGTDAFAVPEDWEYLVVDLAAVLAYRDSDNFDTAAALQADVSVEVEEMKEDLLHRNFYNAEAMVGSGDGSVDW
jgi:hypothetical protein